MFCFFFFWRRVLAIFPKLFQKKRIFCDKFLLFFNQPKKKVLYSEIATFAYKYERVIKIFYLHYIKIATLATSQN